MNIQDNPIYQQMIMEYEQEKEKNNQLNNSLHSQMSVFNSEEQDNLIRWQLDLKEDLDRIYHLLKGDSIGYDKNGNLSYLPQKNPNSMPFNEFGVQLIMNIMSFYLNRNTILSNYPDDVIKWKVKDFGDEVTDLIFNRYEDMMLTIETNDTYEMKEHLREKIKLYPMIVRELVDTIHSAYLRAFNGGERESLRTARTVTQSEPLYKSGMNYPQFQQSQIKTKWYNPNTW